MVVGLLVGGQLIATSSTMFANPQVTLARMFTYSAAGVKPFDGAVFILMQIIGAVLAVLVFRAVTEERRRKYRRMNPVLITENYEHSKKRYQRVCNSVIPLFV